MEASSNSKFANLQICEFASRFTVPGLVEGHASLRYQLRSSAIFVGIRRLLSFKPQSGAIKVSVFYSRFDLESSLEWVKMSFQANAFMRLYHDGRF